MTSEMQEALIAISTYYHPDPGQVFQRIVDRIAVQYGGTMAMINLVDGDRVRYRAVTNPHPALCDLDSVALTHTY